MLGKYAQQIPKDTCFTQNAEMRKPFHMAPQPVVATVMDVVVVVAALMGLEKII